MAAASRPLDGVARRPPKLLPPRAHAYARVCANGQQELSQGYIVAVGEEWSDDCAFLATRSCLTVCQEPPRPLPLPLCLHTEQVHTDWHICGCSPFAMKSSLMMLRVSHT